MLNPQMSQPNSNDANSLKRKDSAELPDSILEAISAYTDKRKKPKRNRSAFILFSIDIRKKRQHEGLDDLNPNDKFVKIAQLWKEASEKERRFYEEKAREEKERYTSELNDFCRIFPAEPIQRPRNHIKKPCNAYGYYLKDIKEEIREKDPELRMCEVLRIVGEKWKTLPPEEKQKYEEKAEIGRKKFKADVSKQMQAMKKVKPNPKISTEKDKGKSSKNSDQESLVCKDPFIVDLETNESKGKEPIQTSPIELSSKRDQENILPPVNQASIPLNMPQRPNRLLENFAQTQYFPSAAETLSYLASFPANTLNSLNINPSLLGTENFSKDTFFALKDLYMKVEQLRTNILLQLRTISTSEQPLLFNYGRIPLFDQSNQNRMRDPNDPSRILSDKNEFKEEEF